MGFNKHTISLGMASLALLAGPAFADWQVNMHPGVTSVSQDIYSLHMTILYICAVIGLLVFGVMFYALIKHRKSIGHQAAHFHESTTVEILWTLIPFIILIAMAIPATRTLIHMDNTEKSDLTIKIIGYQWFWEYEYMDKHVVFRSTLSTPQEQIRNLDRKNPNYLLEVDEPLVLPVGKKIRFVLTSNDVIHSWWVPALGIKRDTNPGFINETWAKIEKTGRYTGQCAELCGANHGFMPIVIEAKSEAEYEAWLKAKQHSAASGT